MRAARTLTSPRRSPGLRRGVSAVMLGALVLCAACADGGPGDALVRESAKSVVRQVAQQRLPGVPADVVTDCVIDHASGQELRDLATAAVTGITDQTVQTVIGISRRPETVQCMIENGLRRLPVVLGA